MYTITHIRSSYAYCNQILHAGGTSRYREGDQIKTARLWYQRSNRHSVFHRRVPRIFQEESCASGLCPGVLYILLSIHWRPDAPDAPSRSHVGYDEISGGQVKSRWCRMEAETGVTTQCIDIDEATQEGRYTNGYVVGWGAQLTWVNKKLT